MPNSSTNGLKLLLRKTYIRVLIHLLEARNKLHLLLFHSCMGAVKLIIAVSSLTWAFLLLVPQPLFIDGRTTYLVMRAIMPETVWGVLFLISGTVGLYSVLLTVKNNITLALDACLGSILWTSSTLACFAAHWPLHISGWLNQLEHWPAPAAMSGEFWLSVAAWWCLVRHVIGNASSPTRNFRKDDFQ